MAGQRCDSCMQPMRVFEDEHASAAWDDPHGAHSCEACGSQICSDCAIVNTLPDAHNPGWQCPECAAENLQEL